MRTYRVQLPLVACLLVASCGGRVDSELPTADAAVQQDSSADDVTDGLSVADVADSSSRDDGGSASCPSVIPEFMAACSRPLVEPCPYRGHCGRLELATCIDGRWTTKAYGCADVCPVERSAIGSCKDGVVCAWPGSCGRYEQWVCRAGSWQRTQHLCDG